jgi:hypothetical protein
VRTPKTIIEEQAQLLTEATQGMLVGAVEDLTDPGQFIYTLNVIVPALNNYKYRILTVLHPLEMYPAHLTSNRPLLSKLLASEGDFEAAVETVLSSTEVKSALSHLKSQVTKL